MCAWFGFVIVFDLGLLGILVATGGAVGGIGREIFPYLLLLNPTDMFRIANLLGSGPVRTYAGLANVVGGGVLSPPLMIIGLVVWTLVPLGLAVWRFNKQET